MYLLLPCLAAGGCGELALRQKERQMELIARDWAMTIRASQVVPVYPLNQDIQPGDVFLVNRTVADQSRRFRDRGFLPTDLRITRLFPEDYEQFYSAREKPRAGAGDAFVLPRDWRDAPPPTLPWERFPKAGFPSYTFDVSNSGGLSVAIPVQSVPLALSVTGAASATGSVTLADAVTYGIDASSMYGLLTEAQSEGRLDAAVPPKGAGPWYLRVVTRVFAAKSFEVVLSARSTLGGGIDAGEAQPVEDPGGRLENGQTVDQINSQLKRIGKTVGDRGEALAGGSVRATFASGRTLGFVETFVEPIVVGYHGFDVAIGSDGTLGPIIPTFQVLEEKTAPAPPTAVTESDSSYIALLDLLDLVPTERATEVLLAAARGSDEIRQAFAEGLEERPGDPVSVWRSVTRPLASTEAGRERLLGWVSRAIRETGG